MKIINLRKIAAIFALGAAIVGSTVAAVLDLPVGTLGKQQQEQKQTINTQVDIDCLHVIVPNTEADVEFKKDIHKCVTHTASAKDQTCQHCIKVATDEAKKKQGNIYFPTNGVQPTTQEAAEYSCANVTSEHVTDWYIRAFGGDHAVEYSKDSNPDAADSASKLGYKKLPTPISEAHITTVIPNATLTTLNEQTGEEYIITVDSADNDFKKEFWKSFKVIASDPVGRVFLYRLIIEIRRKIENESSYEYKYIDPKNKYVIKKHVGCPENYDISKEYWRLEALGKRNNCRSITIKKADSNSFSLYEQVIKFSDSNTIKTSVLKIDGNNIKTEDVARTADIGLFHEMLHWLHYLRDYARYDKDRTFDGSYCHLMMCYYGNNKLQEIFNNYNELFAWATIEYKDEELRTILGTPNYDEPEEFNMFPGNVFVINTLDMSKYMEVESTKKYINLSGKFLNGDDLSENAYRMSRHKTVPAVRMRFGHADGIKPILITNNNKNSFEVDSCLLHKHRFMLPNMVARHCYKNITRNDDGWRIEVNEGAN